VGSFEAAVRKNPTSARAHFHLGNVQFALQQYAAAEASFNMALKACLKLPANPQLPLSIEVFAVHRAKLTAKLTAKPGINYCVRKAVMSHPASVLKSTFLQHSDTNRYTQVLQLPADLSLRPKIHVNMGITVEADGRLLAACHHYQ
jgi:tetratricopeptide (TPR) repeat protein